MAIADLTLTDFRSYASASLSAASGVVVLTGANGAGKTNILEALSLLAPGRGLRGAPLSEMTRSEGPGGFAVFARLADGTTIGTGSTAGAPERRVVRVNNASATAAGLAERLSLIWLTPAQDRLFNDSAGARRRFLDRLVVALEPSHARHAARYEAAMRQRNRLLAEPASDGAWLDALEAAMVEHGTALTLARRALVQALAESQHRQPEAAFPAFELSLHQGAASDPATLRAHRPLDAAAGRALRGPHTHDLLVTYAAKAQPAARSSTGEQKALLIGLILAHAELVAARTGRPPVLLLDEVAAHLDPARRAALFERLAGRGQIWMTGTDEALFADARHALHLTVADGQVRPR